MSNRTIIQNGIRYIREDVATDMALNSCVTFAGWTELYSEDYVDNPEEYKCVDHNCGSNYVLCRECNESFNHLTGTAHKVWNIFDDPDADGADLGDLTFLAGHNVLEKRGKKFFFTDFGESLVRSSSSTAW